MSYVYPNSWTSTGISWAPSAIHADDPRYLDAVMHALRERMEVCKSPNIGNEHSAFSYSVRYPASVPPNMAYDTLTVTNIRTLVYQLMNRYWVSIYSGEWDNSSTDIPYITLKQALTASDPDQLISKLSITPGYPINSSNANDWLLAMYKIINLMTITDIPYCPVIYDEYHASVSEAASSWSEMWDNLTAPGELIVSLDETATSLISIGEDRLAVNSLYQVFNNVRYKPHTGVAHNLLLQCRGDFYDAYASKYYKHHDFTGNGLVAGINSIAIPAEVSIHTILPDTGLVEPTSYVPWDFVEGTPEYRENTIYHTDFWSVYADYTPGLKYKAPPS